VKESHGADEAPDLESARQVYHDSIARLGDLDDEQLDYLANVGSVEDPLSDGLECNHEEGP
jgi:hypothetical protein